MGIWYINDKAKEKNLDIVSIKCYIQFYYYSATKVEFILELAFWECKMFPMLLFV